MRHATHILVSSPAGSARALRGTGGVGQLTRAGTRSVRPNRLVGNGVPPRHVPPHAIQRSVRGDGFGAMGPRLVPDEPGSGLCHGHPCDRGVAGESGWFLGHGVVHLSGVYRRAGAPGAALQATLVPVARWARRPLGRSRLTARTLGCNRGHLRGWLFFLYNH